MYALLIFNPDTLEYRFRPLNAEDLAALEAEAKGLLREAFPARVQFDGTPSYENREPERVLLVARAGDFTEVAKSVFAENLEEAREELREQKRRQIAKLKAELGES